MDGTKLWRIDLGVNIRAGAHYTQFQVYDYDGDGKAEIAMKTAPGSIDGNGSYVTEAGKTEAIRTADNTASYVNSDGFIITGPEYLTIFNGLTGEAMQTIEYDPPRGATNSWGKSNDNTNRVDRFLAGTAYFDGVHPSLVTCRGYYGKAIVVAYDWDRNNLVQRWKIDSTVSGNGSLKGQGNHNLAMADVDNDGFDEVVYGSAIIDDDGTILYSTNWGHGDALHVSDFNNDGKQEIFKVNEDSPNYGAGLYDASGIKWLKKGSKDVGRGIMDYFSPTLGVLAWDSEMGIRTYDGTVINSSYLQDSVYPNFSIYWDGDLCREHLSGTKMSKWRDDSNSFTRLWTIYTNNPVASNNTTKDTPCLQADLFGDWREEIVMRHSDNSALRVFTSLCATDYKFTTLMHDSQYRTGVAWQNTAYNQPPHLSYYIGYDKDVSEYKQPAIHYAPLPETTITVLDSVTNQPVPNVSITIDNRNFIADSNGVVTARLLGGVYDYTMSLNGYIKQTGSITVPEEGITENLQIEPKTYIYNSNDDEIGSAFVYSGEDGATLNYSQSNHEWQFEQNSTDGGKNFTGGFTPGYLGEADIEFIFNTGGKKDSSNAWNWTGRTYSYDIQMLDDTGNIVLGISQEYTASGPNEAQYYTGSVSKTNIVNGTSFGAPNITKRSSTTWKVKSDFNFINQTVTLTLSDELGENGYIISEIPITTSSFASLNICSTATGNVTWGPKVKNVLYWAENVNPPSPTPTIDPSLPTPTPTAEPTAPPTEGPIIAESWNFDEIEAGTTYCDTEENNKINNKNGKYLTVAKAESDIVLPTIIQRGEGNNYLELTDSTTEGTARQDSWSYEPELPLDGQKIIIDFDFRKSNTDKDTILARLFDKENVSTENTYTSSGDGRAFELKTGSSGKLALTDYFSKGTSDTKGNETDISGFTYKAGTWYGIRLEYTKKDNTVNVYTKTDTETDYTLRNTITLGSGITKGSGVAELAPTSIQALTPGGGAVTLGVDNISIGVQGGLQPPIINDYKINGIEIKENNTYINLTKNIDDSSTATVIYACYSEDDLLTYVYSNKVEINTGETTDVWVGTAEQTDSKIRAFVWDSLSGLIPLSDIYVK